MKPTIGAVKLLSQVRPDSTVLDIVVPFTTSSLTRVALRVAGQWTAGLHPFIRVVRTQVVPFPQPVDEAPVSTAVLRRRFGPLAQEFGAHLQICFARDAREGLLHVLSKKSVVLIAARHASWIPRWWKTREERLAKWLALRGYTVVLESVERNNA